IPIALVTSGTGERVSRELVRLRLERSFRAVVCSEDVPRRKPYPEPLLAGLDRLGVAPPDAAYVGDSPEDVGMARAAGVYSVAIPGAFPNREALRAAAPDLLAETLLNAIRALLNP
ncbi:MAG TPA: HAD-IA family hydrolase, partial [Thermoanaerobaculia bacterium]|nr:HAD-IA family hydrolase [Thermoanaerobaculia bacterium]